MKVRINNNEPTSAQRRALRQECVKSFDKMLELYNRQVALQILHILHFDFGFGQKRLKQVSDRLADMQIKTISRYECEDEDVPDICEIQLRESGIDVDELLKE